MMPQLMPFQAPGAAAMDALQEALLQREKQKQQDLINSLAQDQNNRANAASARADAEMKRQAQLDQQKQLDEAVKRQATADTGTIDAMHPAMGDVLQGDLLSAFQRQQPAAIASKPGLTSTSTIGGMAPIGDTSTPDATSTSTSTSDALPIFRGTALQQSAAVKQGQEDAALGTMTPQEEALAKQGKAIGLTGESLLNYVRPKPAAETPDQKSARELADFKKKRDYEVANPTRAPKEAPEPVGVSEDARTAFDGTKYVDGSQYVGKERTQARQEAHAQGVVFLGKEDAAALTEVHGALDNLDYVQQQLQGKLPKDAQGRIVTGTGNLIAKYLQTDEGLAASGALRAAAIKSLRAAAGSKGFRMNEAEINLAVENDIPKITDDDATAARKLDTMRTLIKNAGSAALGKSTSQQPQGGGSALPDLRKRYGY
jgi:hypothetical protein